MRRGEELGDERELREVHDGTIKWDLDTVSPDAFLSGGVLS